MNFCLKNKTSLVSEKTTIDKIMQEPIKWKSSNVIPNHFLLTDICLNVGFVSLYMFLLLHIPEDVIYLAYMHYISINMPIICAFTFI